MTFAELPIGQKFSLVPDNFPIHRELTYTKVLPVQFGKITCNATAGRCIDNLPAYWNIRGDSLVTLAD